MPTYCTASAVRNAIRNVLMEIGWPSSQCGHKEVHGIFGDKRYKNLDGF
jgi:hypothetical protein